jgi:uncharacterized protein YegP (UPF0339 family)
MNTCTIVYYMDGVIWKFDLRASNGKVLFTSPNRYGRLSSAKDAVKVITGLIKQGPRVVIEYE